MRKLLTALVLFLFSLTMQAQIQHVPATYNPVLNKAYKDLQKNPTVRSNAPLTLPFSDDFSNDGPYPNTQNWLDNDVYVNNGYGFQPPSVGVASFDGLKADGTPYNISVNYGPTDSLTSNDFLLGSYTASDSIYMSFYYQAKGNGYYGPSLEDSLILEFKDSSGNWDNILSLSGIDPAQPNDLIPPFFQRILPILDGQYLYDGFQFRFRTYGSQKGSRDHWHIDYVRIATNRNAQDVLFNDVAFTELPKSFLVDYTAMPWDHYLLDQAGLHNDQVDFYLFNHFNQAKTAIATIDVQEIDLGATLLVPQTQNVTINADESVMTTSSKPFSSYDFSGTNGATSANIVTSHYFNSVTNQELTINDSVTFTTVLDNYFAYDDGTAESHVVAQGVGTQIAVKYTAYKADSLKGIYIHIPHINGDIANQLMFFRVWVGSLDSDPIYEPNIAQRPIYVDSINGFTTYAFDNGIPIPAGDFYVGWLQGTATSNAIPVGLDRNNRSGVNHAFFNAGGSWSPFPMQESFQGALMLRPIVGSLNLEITNVEQVEALNEHMSLYPNPVQNQLFIDLQKGNFSDYRFELYNTIGQLVNQGNLEAQISTAELNTGMYFMKIYTEEKSFNYKFIKTE